jgi:hypothetical protein
MEKLTDVLINWQAILLSFAAFAVVGVVRTAGTKKEEGKVVGGWAQSDLFKGILPVLPYLFTLGFVFIPGTPLPDEVSKTIAVKVLYGIWTGWLSDKSYQVVKTTFEKGFKMKFGVDK